MRESFDEVPVSVVEYGSLESVRLVKDFLSGPERFLGPLLQNDNAGSG